MNNAVTNQIYPKKSLCISLDQIRIFDMIYESLTVTRTRITTIIRYKKRTDMQNNLLAFSITAYYCRLEF